MGDLIDIEIIGFDDTSCSPFPCDDTRSCGLTLCHPSGDLSQAVNALREDLKERYGDRVVLKLTRLEGDLPSHIREVIAAHHPPVPIVLISGRLMPFGRVSLPFITKEVDRLLAGSG
ncbi:MAG: hypothetical protein NT074_01660 [Methanomicrobiales archaeon]|nr:hypothetical protein [Methanomicrobiales archaeon]